MAFSQKTSNPKLNKKIVNKWSKFLCFVCGLKLITRGKRQENPVFLVANHVSWLDIPVIHSFKLAGFVAKAEIATWPIMGRIAKRGETLFIARGKHESRKNVLEQIKVRLKQGRSIVVFPEGRATDGAVLAKFHRQLIQAAIEEGVPIQAIAIKYNHPDKRRNKEVCFKENESFVKNVFRILGLPASSVEVVFCESLETKELTARQAAHKTHQQVALVLAENDYM